MHLELLVLIVDDYDRAIRFFVDVLGFDLLGPKPDQ
jgi:catechol 2,3-dioxygenase-like lactoylglutathione lyase family enzyme